MRFTLKKNKFKINTITKILEEPTLFIFKSNNISESEFKKLSKNFNLNFYRLKTNLAKKILTKSFYQHFLNVFEGQLIIAFQNDKTKDLNLAKILNSDLIEIVFKFKNNFYSPAKLELNQNLAPAQLNTNYLLSTKKKMKLFIHTMNLMENRVKEYPHNKLHKNKTLNDFK